MNKKVHFYVNYSNMVVLKNYLDIIRNALSNNGFECDDIKSLDSLDKNDLYVFPMGIDAFKFYHKGFKNFILWQQGATADESYMRNKSKIRASVLNYIDCFAMKKSLITFFCSQYMKEHYEHLARCSFDEKSYLMPCYNETLSTQVIDKKDYSKKNFAYVGSLDLWQCFDEIVSLYKSIEDVYSDASFKVLTFSVQKAKEKLQAYGVKNYEIKKVEKEEVQDELTNVNFGFVIRNNSIVNRVATPTKISSYMSVGIIPIFSASLDDFSRVSKDMKYVIKVDSSDNPSKVIEKICMDIDKEDLKKEYIHLFETYYGTENHTRHISKLMEGLL